MSFSVDNIINDINANIIDISTKMGITIPNTSTTSGFSTYDPIVSLQNDSNFLSNTLQTLYGFAPIVQSGRDPLSDLNNQVNFTVDFVSSIDTSFKFTLETIAPNEMFTLGTDIAYATYDYKIDWGDGNTEDISVNTSQQHTYLSAQSYTVTITGVFPAIQMVGNVQITSILHLGDLGWLTLVNAFKNCTKLTSVNIPVFNPNNLILDCTTAWQGCTLLSSFLAIGLTSVTNCSSAWNGCTSLTSYDSSGLISVTNCNNAWNGTSLTSFSTKDLGNVNDCSFAWGNCTSLITFDTSGFKMVDNCNASWESCTSLVSINTSGLSTATNFNGSWNSCSSLVSIDIKNLGNALDCSYAWASCASLTSFDSSMLTKVTLCFEAWAGCNSLITFDASGLTEVVNLVSAWSGCNSLISFNTISLSKATDCSFAWSSCVALTSFNATGLISITNCTSAWVSGSPSSADTVQWNLTTTTSAEPTFIWLGSGSLATATGWNPGTVFPTNNPWII
jgi:hypothetical protein